MNDNELEVILQSGNYNNFDFDASLFNISYIIDVIDSDDSADYVFKEFIYGTNNITILADKYYDENIDKLYYYRLIATYVQRSRKLAGLHPWDEIITYYSGDCKYNLEDDNAQKIIQSITKYKLEKYNEQPIFFTNNFEDTNFTIYLQKL